MLVVKELVFVDRVFVASLKQKTEKNDKWLKNEDKIGIGQIPGSLLYLQYFPRLLSYFSPWTKLEQSPSE